METLNRREFAALAAAPLLAPAGGLAQAGDGGEDIFVCMHGATSSRADFRTMMEGWARAGIRAVEPDLPNVRRFAQQESPAAARRLLDDLGLRAVSSSNQLFLEEPGDQRAGSLEDLRWKVELAEIIGADRLVVPSAARGQYDSADIYNEVIDNLREAAEIARPHNVTLMVEFTRTSTLINNLRTALKVVREAAHPNLRVMLDTFHFWSGLSKFEDLEYLEPGELHHLHFEDTPIDPPLELFGGGQQNRAFPGEGIAPLARIVAVLRRKAYSGPASLELFHVNAEDPYQMAVRARETIEPLIS
jgi:sugar phosphate isomerase/epimerase